MALKPLNLTRLQHAEVAQLVTRFLDDLDKSRVNYTTDDNLTAPIAKMKTDLANFRAAIQPVRSQPKAAQIAQADKKRGNDLRALQESIRPFRFSNNANEQDAYASLYGLLKTYKQANAKNYEAETLLLSKLIEHLTTSPYKEQVATLGMKRFVDQLADSHASFEAAFSGRSKEKIGASSADAKLLRKQLMTSYSLVVDYIRVMSDVKTLKLYKDLLNVANNSRHYYADLLAKRSKSNKTTTNKTETGTTTTDKAPSSQADSGSS